MPVILIPVLALDIVLLLLNKSRDVAVLTREELVRLNSSADIVVLCALDVDKIVAKKVLFTINDIVWGS